MAATNYTPISLYYSATASSVPVNTNLVAGELAINTNDGKLFYKDSSGVVQVLATKGGVGTSSTTQVLYNSSGLVVGSAGLTFDGTNLATTGTSTATRFIPSGSTIATNGLYLPAANSIGISTNSTNAVYIDSSQNVGIGTSSPQASLNVSYSDASRNDCLRLTNTNTGGYGPWINFYGNYSSGYSFAKIGAENESTGATLRFHTADTSKVSQERMRITNAGNVGIGTSSPQSLLNVYSSTAGNANITMSDATLGVTYGGQVRGYGTVSVGGFAEIGVLDSGTYSKGLLVAQQANYVAVYTGTGGSSAERMRIDSSGNLLVGTTSFAYSNTNNLMFAPSGGRGYFQHISGTVNGTSYADFVYNAGVIGSITQNGTTGVLYNLTSDYRLKDNPQPLTGASEFIMALQPKSWDWWDGSGKGVGFIAHEFMEVAKYSGNGEKDAVDDDGKAVYQSIQPSSSEVMANLVAMVQELSAQVTALQLQIDTMQ